MTSTQLNFRDEQHQLARSTGLDLAFRRLDLGGRRITYVEAGQGAPLVFLHGINMGWGQWHLNLKHFSARYHVYALNLLGAADSDPMPPQAIDETKHLVGVFQ